MNAGIWKPHSMEVGQVLSWPIGGVVFHARHTGAEWQVARQVSGASAEIVWKRWSTGAEERIVEPVPVMSDRSLIVRPEAPVFLAPGHTALFYVSVPLWVRLSAGRDRLITLCDEPTMILSSIWYGEPTMGELCYSLRTRARREDKGAPESQGHRATCRVTMINHAAQPIEFLRLCLPARHLNTYCGSEHLWTDDVSVTMESATLNRVRITGRPADAATGTPAGPARDAMPGTHVLQRSFQTLRNLLG